MHDSKVEDRLRNVLRAEGESLPLTVTTDELERRLVMRRRDRNVRRLSLMAAGIAAVAVGTMFAIRSGWLRGETIGTDATPRPTLGPQTQGPRPVPQLGGPYDAIVTVERVDTASGNGSLDVILGEASGATSVIVSVPIPAGRITSGRSPRVGPTGYLAVPLATNDGDEAPAGVAVYDLLQPTSSPIVVGSDSAGFAWAPDGRLAVFDALTITVFDPATGGQLFAIQVPTGIVVAVGLGGDGIWSHDGRGLLAMRPDGAASVPGILGLDGSFVADPSPMVFAPTGLERVHDRLGRRVGVGCDSSGEVGVAACAVNVETDGVEELDHWYVGNDIGAFAWTATAEEIWLLVNRPAKAGTDGGLLLQRGASGTFEDVVMMDSVIPSGVPPSIVGIAPDDGRIAIAVNDHRFLVVDPASGTWVEVDGQFIGWAEATGARYP